MNQKLMRLALLGCLAVAAPVFGQVPGWRVDAAAFQYQSAMTAVVRVDFQPAGGAGSLLGAFKEQEVRGVAQPVMVGSTSYYFLQLYSNRLSDTLQLRLYDAGTGRTVAAMDPVLFRESAVDGTIEQPVVLDFIDRYNFPPVWRALPDLRVEEGQALPVLDLAGRVTDREGKALSFSAAGQDRISVDIQSGQARLTYPEGFTGTETVVFTAFETADPASLARDTIRVTVTPVDRPPVVRQAGNFTAFSGELFPQILPAEYFNSPDGNALAFRYEPAPADPPVAEPGWTVNAAAFERTMNLTIEVSVFGLPDSTPHVLSVWAGGALRGAAMAQRAGGKWRYFLTAYANAEGEVLEFRLWHRNARRVMATVETRLFSSRENAGTVEEPVKLSFGGIAIVPAAGGLQITARPGFSGTERVRVTATETGTEKRLSVQDDWVFSVRTGSRPRFRTIPGQRVVDDGSFQVFKLDTLVVQPSAGLIFRVKRVEGTVLDAALDAENRVLVTPVAGAGFGAAVFRFTVVSPQDPGAADSADVRFERAASYLPPQPFALLLPGVDATVDSDRFTFRWERAAVFPGRTATYVLRIQSQSGALIAIRGLSDPEYVLDGTEGLVRNEPYWWWVTASDGVTTLESTTRRKFGIGIQVAAEDPAPLVLNAGLHAAYPNPFNPETTLSFTLDRPGQVTLTLLDAGGRQVRTLMSSQQAAGTHAVRLNGAGLASGVYMVQMQSAGRTFRRKITLLK